MLDPTGKIYTATFTATDGFNGSGSVSVTAGSYTDAAGNLGGPGSDTVQIETSDPNDFDSLGIPGDNTDGDPDAHSPQTVYGGTGNDIILGGTGADTLYGGSGNDTIAGNNGAETIFGGSGNDTIDGGNGPDTIIGGWDGDNLTGGQANDIFKYLSVRDSRAGAFDTINFESGDKIDLTAFAPAIGQTAFTGGLTPLIGTSVAANTIAWFLNGTQTIVYANPTGGTLNVGASGLLEIHLAGVSSVALGDFLTVKTAPAGLAGEPINLGLAAANDGAVVTMTIADVPSEWIVNGGTLLNDGTTWTAQTTDPSALTITSPADFTGALVLNVRKPGPMPTAAAADDHRLRQRGGFCQRLHRSSPGRATTRLPEPSAKDLFVFAQPIGNDTIYNFNASEDQIDLIGFAGFASFDDVKNHLTTDVNGNAEITLADGQSITLYGVAADSLGASNFVFNQTPVTNNAGTMTIGDGALLPLSGTINNTGTIALESAGSTTTLQLIQHGIMLQGGGQVTLSDNDANFISSAFPGVTLTNVDNTISGAGQLGDWQTILINQGTIVANGTHALTIDTGSNVVINSGVLEATGPGSLIVNSDVSNSGLIWADGGNITIEGTVTGTGGALISGGILEFFAASSIDVTFAEGSFETLVLDNPTAFTGQIFGFAGSSSQDSDLIDLKGIAFDAGTSWTYYDSDGSDTGGTLTIYENIDGTATAVDSIRFGNGDYTTTSFVLTGDGSGGVLVADPATSGSGTVIDAGNGGNTLTGTAASDTFVFKATTDSQPGAGNFDTITNFTHNSDYIDLTAIAGANAVQGPVDAAGTADAHSISWFVDSVNNQTIVYVNSGDTANHVDMEIHLTGSNINLSGSDILHHT